MDVCNKVEPSENPQRKRANLLKFNMLDFEFLADFLKYLKSLMVVFLESLELE